MRRELISVPDLMAALREHGIDKLADVKRARLEADGEISVIRCEADAPDDGAPRRSPAR